MNTAPGRYLAIVGRSSTGQPRTFRISTASSQAVYPDAAYRRLAAAVLGLDVAHLADRLRSARLQAAQTVQRAA